MSEQHPAPSARAEVPWWVKNYSPEADTAALADFAGRVSRDFRIARAYRSAADRLANQAGSEGSARRRSFDSRSHASLGVASDLAILANRFAGFSMMSHWADPTRAIGASSSSPPFQPSPEVRRMAGGYFLTDQKALDLYDSAPASGKSSYSDIEVPSVYARLGDYGPNHRMSLVFAGDLDPRSFLSFLAVTIASTNDARSRATAHAGRSATVTDADRKILARVLDDLKLEPAGPKTTDVPDFMSVVTSHDGTSQGIELMPRHGVALEALVAYRLVDATDLALFDLAARAGQILEVGFDSRARFRRRRVTNAAVQLGYAITSVAVSSETKNVLALKKPDYTQIAGVFGLAHDRAVKSGLLPEVVECLERYSQGLFVGGMSFDPGPFALDGGGSR